MAHRYFYVVMEFLSQSNHWKTTMWVGIVMWTANNDGSANGLGIFDGRQLHQKDHHLTHLVIQKKKNKPRD